MHYKVFWHKLIISTQGCSSYHTNFIFLYINLTKKKGVFFKWNSEMSSSCDYNFNSTSCFSSVQIHTQTEQIPTLKLWMFLDADRESVCGARLMRTHDWWFILKIVENKQTNISRNIVKQCWTLLAKALCAKLQHSPA